MTTTNPDDAGQIDRRFELSAEEQAKLDAEMEAVEARMRNSGSALAVADDPGQSIELATPNPPEGLSEEDKADIASRSKALMAELANAPGMSMEEDDTIEKLGNVGLAVQRKVGGETKLLRARMGGLLEGSDESRAIPAKIVELKGIFRRIQASTGESPSAGFFGFLGRVPGFSSFLNKFETFAVQCETAQQQVVTIEEGLMNARVMLVRNNHELRSLKGEIREFQVAVQRNAYFGEILMHDLDALIDETQDERKQEKIRAVLHKVVMRVQDLRTMELLNVQFMTSIDVTVENNDTLGDSIERMISIAGVALNVGFMLRKALSDQKDAIDAQNLTRELVGEIVQSNARLIRQNAEAIANMQKEPLVAFEAMQNASNDIMEALDIVDRAKQEGITNGRKNIERLGQMTDQLTERVQGVTALPVAEREDVLMVDV